MRQVSPVEIAPTSVSRYLLPQERSCITVRMHPAALAGPLILVSGSLVAVGKLTSRSVRPEIVRGADLLLLLYFLRRVAAWPVTYFTVTEERMVLIRGLLSRTVAAMPLNEAAGLKLRRTVLGRLLGYGTLIVASPGRRQAFRKVRYLPYPEQLYLEISDLLWPDEEAETVRPAYGGEGMTAHDSAEPSQQE
jgi:hypothetical protein